MHLRYAPDMLLDEWQYIIHDILPSLRKSRRSCAQQSASGRVFAGNTFGSVNELVFQSF